MSLPNIISLGRLMSVPVAVYLILHGFLTAAFWLFVVAGISDAVDGFIAKRFGQETPLGRYLDPLADKALLVGVYVTLGYTGYLPIWLVILVVFRDLIIIGGVVLLHIFNENIRMNPLFISKANTTAQIVLVVVVLAELGVGVVLGPAVTTVLIYLTAMTTVASGGVYVLGWGRNVAAVTDSDQPMDSGR
jgi:cardiolipin synthase (CMP-forming)